MIARNVRAAIALSLAGFVVASAGGSPVSAQPSPKTYQVEWVYRVRYGFEDEWWRLFQKYQISALDEEKRRGYVLDYVVVRPSLHVSEEARWDYRVVITYKDHDAASHESEVELALFPDVVARKRDENRRWELTANHWDLPIHQIDPHGSE
ncbi:hypothetical protein [Caulobacter sp. S45]|jgi:hypothetical protein|uniref:hypothetical protein n=1 Tax=Caulobacter sp. S45 TaxID=1641861 RepID=UPI00131DAEF5|nr:hypothetical protein [Caulobacter sp. S45]